MSSVKRRKIENDTSPELLETKKKSKIITPGLAVASASPEPAQSTIKETTTRDAEPLKYASVHKTFKDLVNSLI